MKDASGSERRRLERRREAELIFPAEGQFRPVVPLSQDGEEEPRAEEHPTSAAPDKPEEPEETTFVPARVSRGPRAAHKSRAKQAVEQSWASLAVAVLLSLTAGAATGVYIFRWQRTAETHRTNPPAEDATPGAVAAEVSEPEPADVPLPPNSSGPAPQAEQDRLASVPVPEVAPVITEARAESGTKAESVNRPTQVQKALPQATEPPPARRATETEPRATRPTREAAQASPAPKLTRAAVAPPRPERKTPAPVTRPERPSLVTSPPASTKPKKVIQWP